MASPDPVLDTNATSFPWSVAEGARLWHNNAADDHCVCYGQRFREQTKERTMADSVYKVIEIIGTSK